MSYKTNRKTKGKFRLPTQIGLETPGTMTGYELCYREGCGHAASMHGTRGCELDPAGHCPAFMMSPSGYKGLGPEDIRAHEEVLAIREAKATVQRQRRQRYADIEYAGSVSDLNTDEAIRDWSFIDRDTDVEQTLRDLNVSPNEGFGAMFVRNSATARGEITPDDVYFINGTVPDLDKTLYKVKPRTTTNQKTGFNIAGEKDTRYFSDSTGDYRKGKDYGDYREGIDHN